MQQDRVIVRDKQYTLSAQTLRGLTTTPTTGNRVAGHCPWGTAEVDGTSHVDGTLPTTAHASILPSLAQGRREGAMTGGRRGLEIEDSSLLDYTFQ